MNEPLTDEQVRNLLKSEWPTLFPQDIDRITKTCRTEKWFKELLKRAPRSIGLTQGLNTVDVEKIGVGEQTEAQSDNLGKSVEAEETEDCAPDHLESADLEQAKSELAEMRAAQLRQMEFMAELILSSHVSRVQHMRCSIGLALLKGNLDPAEVATHFGVSDETVRVQTKKVEETIKNLGA